MKSIYYQSKKPILKKKKERNLGRIKVRSSLSMYRKEKLCARIEIAGVLGAGKTTLANHYAQLGYNAIHEKPEENPFLQEFYFDPQKYSFETEIAFLVQHYHLIKRQPVDSRNICDFSFVSDLAYARYNLSSVRYGLFQGLCLDLLREIGIPKKVVLLKCHPDILLQRIKKRGRPYEQSVRREYLSAIQEATEEVIRGMPLEVSIIPISAENVVLPQENIHLKNYDFL